MNRYIFISVAIATIISGCTFGSKPWETGWRETPVKYDLAGVQNIEADKPEAIIHEQTESESSSGPGLPMPPTLQPATRNPQTATINHQSSIEKNQSNRYPIDLTTVLRLAGANHLDIALFREKTHEAYANAIVAFERFIPTLSPGIRFDRREGEKQRSAGPFIEVDAQQTFIGANITLDWDMGDAIYSTLAEMKRYRGSRAALKAKEHDAILEAALNYIELSRAQAEVVISEEAVEIAKKLVSQTDAALQMGMGFKGDVLRAKAQLSGNKLALTAAKELFKVTSVQLVSVLRLDPGIELYSVEKVVAPIKLIGDDGKLSDLVRKGMMLRPELKEAEAELNASKDEHSGTILGPLIPSFKAEAGAGGLGEVPDKLASREDYRFSLGWKVGPGGLFDVGRQHQTKSKYETQRIRSAKLMQKIEQDIRIAYAHVQAKAEQIKIAEGGVTDAAESLKLNQERQKMGIGIPLEVLQAEEALTRARLDYLLAITEYNKSQFILFTKIGKNPVDATDKPK